MRSGCTSCIVGGDRGYLELEVPIPLGIGLACEKWLGHVNPGAPGFAHAFPVASLGSRALAFACLCLFCGAFTRIPRLPSIIDVASSASYRLCSRIPSWKSASYGRHMNHSMSRSVISPSYPVVFNYTCCLAGILLEAWQTYTWPRTSFRRATSSFVLRAVCSRILFDGERSFRALISIGGMVHRFPK